VCLRRLEQADQRIGFLRADRAMRRRRIARHHSHRPAFERAARSEHAAGCEAFRRRAGIEQRVEALLRTRAAERERACLAAHRCVTPGTSAG
jgi:hypothetical protein